MGTIVYDIFQGTNHHDAMWLEAVMGLDQATMRMHEICKESPSCYFVFCSASSQVVASVTTEDCLHPAPRIH